MLSAPVNPGDPGLRVASSRGIPRHGTIVMASPSPLAGDIGGPVGCSTRGSEVGCGQAGAGDGGASMMPTANRRRKE